MSSKDALLLAQQRSIVELEQDLRALQTHLRALRTHYKDVEPHLYVDDRAYLYPGCPVVYLRSRNIDVRSIDSKKTELCTFYLINACPALKKQDGGLRVTVTISNGVYVSFDAPNTRERMAEISFRDGAFFYDNKAQLYCLHRGNEGSEWRRSYVPIDNLQIEKAFIEYFNHPIVREYFGEGNIIWK